MAIRAPGARIIAVLPAYRAARTLEWTVAAIPREWFDQVILVDDASPDETVAVAERLGLKTFRHPVNRGYGGNQKTCYREALAAGADIVVMIHPDFQYDPAFAPGLIEPIVSGRRDAMFGSRMLEPGGARAGGMPWWKFMANVFLTRVGNLVLGLRLSEYHSGFRAYSRRALERVAIEFNSDNFVFDTEIIAQLKIAGCSIGEIPITTRYFPEASTVGLGRSVEYGLSFLGVLAKYLGHCLGLVPVPSFLLLDDSVAARCPACRSERHHILFPARPASGPAGDQSPSYLVTQGATGHGSILRCSECRLVYVPRAQTPELVRLYRDQPLDREYLAEEQGRRRAARRLLRAIASRLAGGGRRLVDVGAGPGFFVDEARRIGWEAAGLEPGASWAAVARERLGAGVVEPGGLDVIAAMADESLDVITAWDLLEHLEDPFYFLGLASRKLRPDGLLALTTPNIGSITARLARERWHALLPSHITFFTPATIQRALEASGFDLIYSRSYVRFFSLRYLAVRLGWRRASAWLGRIIVPVNLGDDLEIYARRRR